jgi:2-iminoacetate synthase
MYTFDEELDQWPAARILALIEAASPGDVERALRRSDRGPADFAALLSPRAQARFEDLAREAQRLTRRQFGRTISLYAPIYVSNVCGADCTYCGYAVRSGNREKRVTLSPEQLRRECGALAAQGFQSVLLLTGEARHAVPVDTIAEAVSIAREFFPSVSIEVYSLDAPDYERLCRLGLDGVTIYMETYDREVYSQVHLLGEKADYGYRLDAIERAGHAGARKLNIAVLLGLSDWRVDAFRTALHARYLQRACWQSSIAVSFPRLSHVPERFHIPQLVSDAQFVQYLLAMRLYLPEAPLVLSTRETPALRDRLVALGVTHMSAGSSTRPGGYATHGEEVLEQFALEDLRSPAEVESAIRRAGYDPVWKDFDRAFDAAGAPGAAEC